jgi:hypothetical protein
MDAGEGATWLSSALEIRALARWGRESEAGSIRASTVGMTPTRARVFGAGILVTTIVSSTACGSSHAGGPCGGFTCDRSGCYCNELGPPTTVAEHGAANERTAPDGGADAASDGSTD